MAFDLANDTSLWFYSGILLIVLGKYVAEPFFTKPTDSLTNSLAVLIALLTIDSKASFFGYQAIFIFNLTVLVFSLVSIGLKDAESNLWRGLSRFTYWFSVKLGASNVLFSIIFLSSIYSYFALSSPPDIVDFIILLAFWICIVFFDLVGLTVEVLSGLRNISKTNSAVIGKAIGCENPLLYKVEIGNENSVKEGDIITIENRKKTKSVGIVISVRQLLNKQWANVYLLQDENKQKITVPSLSAIFSSSKSILSDENSAFHIDSVEDFSDPIKEKINSCLLYQNFSSLIGFVESGSNLNTLKFHILGLSEANHVSEGAILKVQVNGVETLYQVIDGNTRDEPLENQDVYGFTIGVARKLGYYNLERNELGVVSWMPEIFTPVFLHSEDEINEEERSTIAEKFIGRLPTTSYPIPIVDYHSLVTHNTAILGILGIGKSCLTFELIKKSIEKIESLKVICIDITNEYAREDRLPRYISDEKIERDVANSFNQINAKIEFVSSDENGKQYPDKSGNKDLYRNEIRLDLLKFLFDSQQTPNEYVVSDKKNIRVYNPDFHKVSKGEKIGYNVITTLLSAAEKTRIICEEILRILMEFDSTDGSSARVMIVFEEAHSLVPEWGSAANDGDVAAVNGTAKIILQGRKYGLGSLVITQRTANISKSILNQCNTIFALRVFDDTGKQFLENYIGSDYSNTLPTLEERHVIAVGKALRLKQPVIIQLNDRKYLTQQEEQDDDGQIVEGGAE
ncbi:ATP-binding protein [Ekhidna sp.]|uniref:ATP-binding protein n=1 Tax=Ekhidna sp. TaxID=2608089 RepID=UPI003CCBBEAE